MCWIILCCSQQLYIPNSGDSSQQKQLLEGRKYYIKHCGGCHNLHLPQEYKAEQWNKILFKMQPRAKISDQEKDLILKYLASHPY